MAGLPAVNDATFKTDVLGGGGALVKFWAEW